MLWCSPVRQLSSPSHSPTLPIVRHLSGCSFRWATLGERPLLGTSSASSLTASSLLYLWHLNCETIPVQPGSSGGCCAAEPDRRAADGTCESDHAMAEPGITRPLCRQTCLALLLSLQRCFSSSPQSQHIFFQPQGLCHNKW